MFTVLEIFPVLPFFNFLRLCKDTSEGKRQQSVLSPVSRPSGLMKMEPAHPQRDTDGRLQVENTRQYYPGRESQITTAATTRSSQTALL